MDGRDKNSNCFTLSASLKNMNHEAYIQISKNNGLYYYSHDRQHYFLYRIYFR